MRNHPIEPVLLGLALSVILMGAPVRCARADLVPSEPVPISAETSVSGLPRGADRPTASAEPLGKALRDLGLDAEAAKERLAGLAPEDVAFLAESVAQVRLAGDPGTAGLIAIGVGALVVLWFILGFIRFARMFG